MYNNLTLSTISRKIQEDLSLSLGSNGHLRPMVSLTFDDGYDSDYNIVRPIFEEFGFRGTFFPISDLIGSSERFMTPEQLKYMADIGHEIGTHTKTHASLIELSREEIKTEMRESKLAIQDITGHPVETLCYPYGHSNDDVRDIASGFFIGARNFWRMEMTDFEPIYTGNRLKKVVPYGNKYSWGIPGKSADTLNYYEFVATINEFLALEEAGHLTFVFHRVHRDDDPERPNDRQTETLFYNMMQFLNEKKKSRELDVVPFKEGIKRLNGARSIHLS